MKLIKMKKEDLKTGMLVKHRDGTIKKIFLDSNVGDVLVSQEGIWGELANYHWDMTRSSGRSELDIMEVYKSDMVTALPSFNLNKYTLIWRREHKQTIEVTVKINGENTSPLDISEETWKNLRKQS